MLPLARYSFPSLIWRQCGYHGLASCLLCLNDLRNWIQKKGNADVLDFIVQDERTIRVVVVVVMPSCLSGTRYLCWGSIRLTIQVTLTTWRHRCSYTNYTPSALVEQNVNWHIANLIFCLGLHLHSKWSFLISLAFAIRNATVTLNDAP